MTTLISSFSKASEKTQKILEELSKKSETRIMKLEANVDQSIVNNAWTGLGIYLSRQMKMGRAVNIPKFGVLTFAAPEVKLDGVTNPNQRDIRLRRPVFIVNKDFAKGVNIKSGIYADFGVRPYSNTGVISGVGQTKANYTEIGSYIGIDKDTARICIERVIRELAEKARNGSNVEMEIPNLGVFYIKGNIAAINFDEFLVNEVVDVTNKNLRERKNKGETNLTTSNIQQFLQQTNSQIQNDDDFIEIDPSAQEYMKTMLGIDVKKLSLSRPKTAGVAVTRQFDTKSVISQNSFNNGNSIFGAKTQNSAVKFNSRPLTANSANRESIKLAPISDLDKAKKKIKFWIRNKSLFSEEAFAEIAIYALGPHASQESKLNLEEFERGLQKIIGLNLEKSEIDALFNYLDSNKTGYVTSSAWLTEFTNDRSYLNYIRDVITKYNLQPDDVLRRMDLTKSSPPLNADEISNALLQLDPSLNDFKASKLAKEILNDKEKISIQDFISIIGCSSDDGGENNDWFNQQLIRIKRKLDLNKLRQEFEKYDEKNQGIIDTAGFKTLLARSKLGISIDDINRFTRYIEKDINMNIDYYKFMKMIEEIKSEEELQLYTINKDLSLQDEVAQISKTLVNYLRVNNISPLIFLKKIQDYKRNTQPSSTDDMVLSRRVNIDDFANTLYNLFKDQVFNKNVFSLIAGLIDIDHDGLIDENDLNIYLGRYEYMDLKNTIKNNFLNITKASEIFPKQPLSEEKVEIVLRDLRQALDRKRISYFDFVKQIDPNDVGFISINQLNMGLDKVLKLSQPAKDGLFAYLDKQKIGLLDPKEFLKILKRTIIDKNIEVTEDNFDWQNDMMRKIKLWSQEKKLKPEDAFRVMDVDFDGFISKNDLATFLKEVMKLPSSELTSQRVDRLYKLLDVFKRDAIQFNDIKRFFEEDIDNGNNLVISGGKPLIGRSTFDWKIHAKQQLGLALSKHFTSLAQSFEQISQHTMKMTYKHFSTWAEKNMALNGFNLTEKLMQQLFADLDPHKKGHLTQLDWENAFSGYNADNQIIDEIIDILNSNFPSANDAFDYFVSQENSLNSLRGEITISAFRTSINALLPKRFDPSQINYIWNTISKGAEIINFNQFAATFDNGKYTGSKKISLQKFSPKNSTFTKSLDFFNSSGVKERKTLLSTQKIYNEEFQKGTTKHEKQENVCEKMKTILHAANVSLHEFYRQMDTDNNGSVSNLEFTNAIKKLRLGLTLQEIEDLVNYCDLNADGRISFNEFMKKFEPTFNDKRIFDRSRIRLKKIKENIYSYMLSPKDAFLQFNEDRTGKLTYNQFNKFIMTLVKLAGEEPPTFSIIKDLFDFIDIRKDGIIDMNEWMQSFRLVESEITPKVNRRPQTVGNSLWAKKGEFTNGGANYINDEPIKMPRMNLKKERSHTEASSKYQKIANMVSEWECSKEYDKVMKVIARNRKVLATTFKDLNKLGVPLTFDKAKEILVDLLRNNGITINDEYWAYLLKVAERDSIIDYKFLLDVFKERCQMLVSHPKTNVIQIL